MSKVLEMLRSVQFRAEGRFPPSPAPSPPVRAAGARSSTSFVEFYRLRENPFSDALNLSFYYRTAAQEAAARKMAASVRDGISLGLVTGPSGSGKSMLTQILLEGLGTETCGTILVSAVPGMGKTALLREMLREAAVEPAGHTAAELVETLHKTVLALHREGRRLVVLLDEAHFLSSDALHILRTVSNLEGPEGKLATCLLFAEDGFLRRLRHPSYRSLMTRMYQRVTLEGMSAAETEQYIKYRLLVAGGSESLFETGVFRAIHARTAGICREVNRLCYLSLAESAALGLPTVSSRVTEGV